MKKIFLLTLAMLSFACCKQSSGTEYHITVTFYNGDTEDIILKSRKEIILDDGDLMYVKFPTRTNDWRTVRSSVRSFEITKEISLEPVDDNPTEIQIKSRK